METLQSYLVDLGLQDISWVRYVAAFLIIFFTLFLRKIFDIYIARRLHKWAQKTAFKYDDAVITALRPPSSAVFLVLGVFFAIKVMDLPNEPIDVAKFASETFRISWAIIAVWAVFRLTDVFAEFLGDRIGTQDESLKVQFFPLLKKALRIFVLILGILMIIQNLGYSVSSLIAGLGIGGLAVALAAQETLANFFGSLVMLTDRPFKLGDWVQIGDIDGEVEELGFRSTRVRTWSKSVVTIPNKVLVDSHIENWSLMTKRRVKQTLGLTYDTSTEKMEAYLEGVREILKNDPEIDQELHFAYFNEFNASSLDIFIQYFTISTNRLEYLRVMEKNNLQWMKLADKVGVSFAFPSQTLYWGPGEKPQG